MNDRHMWLDITLGTMFGITLTLIALLLTTDVDTPVANEPKCETIIIHK